MKLIGKVLVIIMLSLLAACNDSEITDPTLDPIIYQFDIESFESFFLIETDINETDDIELSIKLNPIHTYSEMTGNVTIKVYLSYMFNEVNLNSTYQFTFDMTNLVEKTEFIDSFFDDCNIYYIQVSYAMGSVKTVDEVNISQKDYVAPTFVPQHEDVFSIDNVELNQQLFDELDIKIENIKSRNDFTYLTMYTKITQGYTTSGQTESESVETLIQLADDYIFYFDGFNQGIITQEEEKLLHYFMNPLYVVSNKQVVELSIIDSIDDVDINISDNQSIDDFLFDSDASKVKISKDETSYHIIGYLIDLIPIEEYHALVRQLMSVGISPAVLQRATMTFIIEISNDELSMISEMNLNLPHNLLSSVTAKVEMLLSYNMFEKIDVKSDAYTIEPPDEFDEVFFETNVLGTVTQVLHGRNHKYLTYLEKGQYKFIDVDQQRLQLMIYDLDLNRLNVIPLETHIYGTEIFIPEDGYYYLNIHQTISNNLGYSFYFLERNYETLWDDEFSIHMGLNVIISEGQNDIVLLRFDTIETKFLKLHVNNTQIFGILPNTYFYGDGIHFIEAIEGTTYLSLIGDVAGTIELEVTEVDTAYYQSTELETMEEIQESPSEFIVTSENFGPRYLKLVVTEPAYYELIHTRPNQVNRIVQPDLLSSNMGFITHFPEIGMFLNEGTYVLRFYSVGATIGAISYEKTVMNVEATEIDLPIVEYSSEMFSSSTVYELRFFHQDYYVDFHVNSVEGLDLYIHGSTNLYQILDEYKNPLTFVFGDSFYTQVSLIFHFEPGSYYIRYFAKHDHLYYSNVRFAYVSNLPEDDSRAGSQIPWITLGDHYFTLDYTEDAEIFKIEITEAGTYAISTSILGYPVIYDSLFNRIPQNSESYYFEPGIYYIFLPNRDGRTLNIRKID